MSDSGSEPREAPRPFVEDDGQETQLPYDTGGVPAYIVIAWVGIIVAYPLVMWLLALPDLRRWLAR